MAGVGIKAQQDYAKHAFFVLLALCTVAVIFVDERFLVAQSDPKWTHIAKFKWLLLAHGLAGLVAFICGPVQFSDKLRTERPALHRAVGWTFIVTGSITAVMGTFISIHFEPRTIQVEEYFHGGLILMSLAMAVACILNKNIQAHKLWMMRAYGVLLVFIWGRIPDVFHYHMNDQVLADVLWSGVVVGVLAPDLMLTGRDLARRLARRAR
jgi:uncharacterized membrane protein